MIVSFDIKALNSVENPRWHDEILGLFEDGRHKWAVSDPEEIRASRWYQEKGLRDRRRVEVLLEQARPAGTYSSRNPSLVVDTQYHLGESWHLEPAQACRVLKHPVTIVVENSQSDGAFLRAVMLRFGEKILKRTVGEQEFQEIKKRWEGGADGDGVFFQILHSGGATIGTVLSRHWKSKGPLPLIVLVDSDLVSPEQPRRPRPGSTWEAADSAFQALDTSQVPNALQPRSFVLERRTIENYLPREALETEFRGDRLRAYLGLSEHQRYYYNLKSGFSMEPDPADDKRWRWKTAAELERRLFTGESGHGAAIDEETTRLLRDGFGNNVAKCWNQDHTTLNSSSLRDEAGDDFLRLVTTLLEAI